MKDADAEAAANKPDKEAPTEEISEPKKVCVCIYILVYTFVCLHAFLKLCVCVAE